MRLALIGVLVAFLMGLAPTVEAKGSNGKSERSRKSKRKHHRSKKQPPPDAPPPQTP
jgi:hypothetical protein